LTHVLQDEVAVVRYSVVRALGSIGSEDAVPDLIQLLQDPERIIRLNVAWALGQIGTPDAISTIVKILPDLIHALQDEKGDVRNSTARTLGEIGERAKSAVPALTLALRDEDVNVRAAKALREIGTPDALNAVEESQQHKK